jgi:Holliday junction resolvase RusA-like endonuclease
MSEVIQLEVPGRPVAWERVRTNQGRFFKPKRTRDYEERVAWACRASSAVIGNADCQVMIEFCAKRKLRGDLDNYAKAVLDGLQIGGMIENDRQVKTLSLSYGGHEEDVTRITLRASQD